ncbi:MAG: hypothetical protein R3313_04910 [Candidatus Saccharimonadales bacterium]|nr:hypothetical protein [Candidatus Saccharimonadales bacterium]
MEPDKSLNRRKVVNIVRTIIAVSLILFPIINFLLDVPAIVDLLGGDSAATEVVEQ